MSVSHTPLRSTGLSVPSRSATPLPDESNHGYSHQAFQYRRTRHPRPAGHRAQLQVVADRSAVPDDPEQPRSRSSGAPRRSCGVWRTEIGIAHFLTPVTNAHLVCLLLLVTYNFFYSL